MSLDTPILEVVKEELNIDTDLKYCEDNTVIKEEFDNLKDDETESQQPPPHNLHNTELGIYLRNNLNVFKDLSGFPSIDLFEALLDYVEDDIIPIKGATKCEQLFSTLAKLHYDEDNTFINSYLFPAVYIRTIDVLYQKLDMLYMDCTYSSLPSLFLPEFDSSQRVVILGVIHVSIRSTFQHFPEDLHKVKYLIGYLPTGEVFFVSRAFSNSVNNFNLVTLCGILNKVSSDNWILVNVNNCIYVTQADKISIKNKHNLQQINSSRITEHVVKVVNRLHEHFKILHSFMPDYMLEREQTNICFLDKLVFVCCMILNMFPRVVYS